MIGREFGRLRVKARAVAGSAGHHRVVCRCECRKVVEVRASDLLAGRTRSCGCLRVETSARVGRKHGLYYTREYREYLAAKLRAAGHAVPFPFKDVLAYLAARQISID